MTYTARGIPEPTPTINSTSDWDSMAETRNPGLEVEDPSDGVEVDCLVMASFLQGSNTNHIMSQLQIAATSQSLQLQHNNTYTNEAVAKNRNTFAKQYIASWTLIKIGIIHYQQGHCENAFVSLKKALDLAQAVRKVGMQEILTKAMEIWNVVSDQQDPSLAKTMNSQGMTYTKKGNYRSSLQLHRNELQVFKASPSKEVYLLDAAQSHTYIGVANKIHGDIQGAMQHFKAAK
eukprot:15366412-Ditylum_brightwellii.AAC.1